MSERVGGSKAQVRSTVVDLREYISSKYAARKISISPTEMTVRTYTAQDVIRCYLERRELVPRGIKVQNYAKMADQTGGGSSKPDIAAIIGWLVDVEKALRAIGVAEARILIARLRKRPVKWSEIEAYFNCGRHEAKSRFDVAVVAFTDELQRRGITEKIDHSAAA